MKQQQMGRSRRGAHLPLRIRTRALNQEWENTFRSRSPAFRPKAEAHLKKAARPPGISRSPICACGRRFGARPSRIIRLSQAAAGRRPGPCAVRQINLPSGTAPILNSFETAAALVTGCTVATCGSFPAFPAVPGIHIYILLIISEPETTSGMFFPQVNSVRRAVALPPTRSPGESPRLPAFRNAGAAPALGSHPTTPAAGRRFRVIHRSGATRRMPIAEAWSGADRLARPPDSPWGTLRQPGRGL